MRKIFGCLLAAVGLFLCVFVAYAPYSLLETYGNPDVGVVANITPRPVASRRPSDPPISTGLPVVTGFTVWPTRIE